MYHLVIVIKCFKLKIKQTSQLLAYIKKELLIEMNYLLWSADFSSNVYRCCGDCYLYYIISKVRIVTGLCKWSLCRDAGDDYLFLVGQIYKGDSWWVTPACGVTNRSCQVDRKGIRYEYQQRLGDRGNYMILIRNPPAWLFSLQKILNYY